MNATVDQYALSFPGSGPGVNSQPLLLRQLEAAAPIWPKQPSHTATHPAIPWWYFELPDQLVLPLC